MKILHLASFLQSRTGFAIAELARRQQAAGHNVTVLTSKTGVSSYGNAPGYVGALREAGVDVTPIDSLFRRDYAANLNVVGHIQQLSAARPFDVMHAHAPVPGLIALLAASGTSTHVLQTLHRWGVRKSPAQTQSDIAVLRQSARVVVPSASTRAFLLSSGLEPARVAVIPYGVSPVSDPFESVDAGDADIRRARDARAAGRAVVCSIGTVDARKNPRLLVDALAAIPETSRPFCLIVGEGEIGPLSAYAQARGIGETTRVCGYKANARRILREADALVFPSIGEGLPLTLLEAFCDRVPVIASDVPEMSAVIRHGHNGILFSADDALGLAAALRTTLGLSAEARAELRQQAHAAYRAQFTASAMADRYMGEYRALDGAAQDAWAA